jgi:hypothetical protein
MITTASRGRCPRALDPVRGQADFAGEGLRGETVVIGDVFAFAILFASTVRC